MMKDRMGGVRVEQYERHLRIWRWLQLVLQPWITRKFRLTHEDLDLDGPVLLVSNHVCAWDPLLVAMSLKKKHVYYVASEHLFRLGLVTKVLNALVAPIPRRKAAAGSDTAKACLRHLRVGHSICLFAEGEQCWDGKSQPVFPATGKLAKSSGAALVTFRIEGGYLSCPRWGKGVRRGKVHVHPVNIYSPEQLKTMTPQQIDQAIDRDISENAWERQREAPVAYRGRRLAEGLERALYLCPGCGKIGQLHTKDDRIYCRCGFERRYTETGFFSPETPFAHLGEWDSWQRKMLQAGDYPHRELLFSDDGFQLDRIGSGHRETTLATGAICQYEDRLECGGYSFPMSKISNMAAVLTALLLFSYEGEYYQLSTRSGANIRKYYHYWQQTGG